MNNEMRQSSEMIITPEELSLFKKLTALLKPYAERTTYSEERAVFDAEPDFACCGDQECIDIVAYSFMCQGRSPDYQIVVDDDNENDSSIRRCLQCGKPLSHSLHKVASVFDTLYENRKMITKDFLNDTDFGYNLYVLFNSLPSYDFDDCSYPDMFNKQQALKYRLVDFANDIITILSK